MSNAPLGQLDVATTGVSDSHRDIKDGLWVVREKLLDAAAHWADKASQTVHYSDARSYATVARDIADLASNVEGIRFQWFPQMVSVQGVEADE